MCGISRYVLLLAIGLSTTFLASAEVIHVLTYKEAPYASDVNGKKQGMIVELVAELFHRAKIDYSIEFSPLKRTLVTTRLKANYCALPIERSQEREITYKWVSPVMVSRYGLFSDVTQSIPLTTLKDAEPYVIGSSLGSGIAEYLKRFGYQVVVTARSDQNIKMLKAKRIDLWAADVVSAKNKMLEMGINLGESELIFFTSIRAMACNSAISEANLQRLQFSMSTMYQDGFMLKLYNKYQIEF